MSRPSLAPDASPEAFAEAMVKCQLYAPACSDAEACQLDGWCFGNDGNGFRTARRVIADLIAEERNVFVRSWLKMALDALDHHKFLENRAIDALKLIRINREVRSRYTGGEE